VIPTLKRYIQLSGLIVAIAGALAFRFGPAEYAPSMAVSGEIGEVKAKLIKGDLGMKIADFNTLLRLYKLECEDRDELIDVLREGFRALGIGESMDFVAAMEKMPAPAPAAQEEQPPPIAA